MPRADLGVPVARRARLLAGVQTVGVSADSTSASVGLLVVGHGSRRPEANETLRAAAAALAAKGDWAAAEPAFLELAHPDIAEAYAALAAAGCGLIVVHPFFLLPGNHTMRDIPDALQQAQRSHPATRWMLTAPLGLHEGVLEAASGRIAETLLATAVPTG